MAIVKARLPKTVNRTLLSTASRTGCMKKNSVLTVRWNSVPIIRKSLTSVLTNRQYRPILFQYLPDKHPTLMLWRTIRVNIPTSIRKPDIRIPKSRYALMISNRTSPAQWNFRWIRMDTFPASALPKTPTSWLSWHWTVIRTASIFILPTHVQHFANWCYVMNHPIISRRTSSIISNSILNISVCSASVTVIATSIGTVWEAIWSKRLQTANTK